MFEYLGNLEARGKIVLEHVKGSTLKMDESGSFETLITSFQSTHHYMQMIETLTLYFCAKS
jgi:hypothetical protein